MRVGLISDVHGNHKALKHVLSALVNRAEKILFLGDLVGYYSFVGECFDLWGDKDIVSIRGNHDQVLLECKNSGQPPDSAYTNQYGSALERSMRTMSQKNLSVLKSWPTERHLTLDSVSISMYHGAPWAPLEGRIYPDFKEWGRFDEVPGDIILLGHTHYPLVKRWKGKMIVNPGSVGQSRDESGSACYAELDTVSGEIKHRRIPYDASALVTDALDHDPKLPYLAEVLTR